MNGASYRYHVALSHRTLGSLILGQVFKRLITLTDDRLLDVYFQGEMQQLRDKLAVAERTAKSEAQLKVGKLLLCL